ncbi:MAG: calcium-binding protein, partial [Sideroxyarcus sp.]|nr:calcium-binding protein [Sideroxyarcus sp.]
GGAGDDALYGEAGADTYVFGRGYGHDQIFDTEENGYKLDMVRFVGLTPADISVSADTQENLTFTVRDTGETLFVPAMGTWWNRNGVGQYVFENGTIWLHDDALSFTIVPSTDGDDAIHGSSAWDVINGQAGNDVLVGQGGDDLIDGGTGNDTLIGSSGWTSIYENDEWRSERNFSSQISANGNDTYLFGRGDGKDTVIDGDYTVGNSDTLRFKSGVLPADIQIKHEGDDLVLSILGTEDQVTLKDYFQEHWYDSNRPYSIERIAFDNGTAWSYADIQASLFAGTAEADTIIGTRLGDHQTGQDGDDTLIGRPGNDVLEGGAGDDVLLGGIGRDVLDGGAGNDVLHGNADRDLSNKAYEADGDGDSYRFGRGDGHDTIIDTSWWRDAIDRIELKAGITTDDVRLQRVRTVKSWWQVEDDLVLTLRDTGESITVKKQFDLNKASGVEEIVFADGTVWTLEDVRNRVLSGEAGNDELIGFAGRNDALQGGAGNDRLMGLGGSDTYRFNRGDGQDEIIEGSDQDGIDIVELGAGIGPEDVTVRWTLQGGVAIRLASGESIVVRDQANPSMYEGTGIEALRFADGTEWDRATLTALAQTSTDGNDAIVGGYGDDLLDGGLGDDQFQDLAGYDTYQFGLGDGHDVIDDAAGRVLFKSGIGQNDVQFTRDGNDLLATLKNSGDSIRLTNWFDKWQHTNSFEFVNGARLNDADVYRILSTGDGWEVLYGSPNDDVLSGTDLNSDLFGREGNDTLLGNGGEDYLMGEAGDDTLDGGAGRDWLQGGQGQNTYIVNHGMGLDHVSAQKLQVANDTVVFAQGIRPEDLTVQLGERSWVDNPQAGDVGLSSLVIGIGGDDAIVIQTYDWQDNDIGRSAVQSFRFADGTQLTLADMIARADGGVLGGQSRNQGDATTLLGSQADDDIQDYTGDSVTVRARGNNDRVYLAVGNDIVSAGSGQDYVDAGAGDDLIAGERGNDQLNGGEGDDVFVFNYGDGQDELQVGDGIDTLSFGANITPAMLTVAFSSDERLVLRVDGGAGGTINLRSVAQSNYAGVVERLQFIDGSGNVQVFDFAAWLRSNSAALAAATSAAPLAFTGGGFELTGLIAPVGGLEAVAYAQTSDLFATATLANNSATAGNDVLYGTAGDDVIDAADGSDVVMGLLGNDTLLGGTGNDVLHGGDGDDLLEGGADNDVLYGGHGADVLNGGTGNDQLLGGWGGDTYQIELGTGEVIIDDDHRVLRWGNEGGEGGEYYGDGYEPGYEPGYGGMLIDDAPNVLVFGAGIRAEDLRYSELNGDLLIEFANSPNDRVILRGYDANRATLCRSVDVMRFADGTEMVVEGIEVTGNTAEGDDFGGRLDGTEFADTLIGGEGEDVLNAQGGSDTLIGGGGSDTYQIYLDPDRAGKTETVIVESWRSGDRNRIEITGNVYEEELSLEFNGTDLVLHLGEGGDTIRFAGFDPRTPGLPSPVNEISLQWQGVDIDFDTLLARGIRLIGTPSADVLVGTALSDWLEGLESDDILQGGAGGDTYVIGNSSGNDTIVDVEDGGAPNLLILPEWSSLENLTLSFDSQGFLIIDLGEVPRASIRLSGFNPDDPFGPHAIERFRFGEYGVEISYEELLSRGFDIIGTDEPEALTGTVLSDRLYGQDGNDLLDATPGGDLLMGDAGNDVYVVNLGDGEVTIDDWVEDGASNVLRFGASIEVANLRNSLRFEEDDNGGYVLLIPYGDAEDVVRLVGFNPEDVLDGNHAVDRFEFADGTVVDYATLVSWTIVVEGSNDADALSGTSVADRLYGYDGDDVLDSGDGDDVLTAGTGNDLLVGGGGRDAYVLNLGDGEDVIEDAAEAGIGNIVNFGAGIAREDVSVSHDGNDLLIHYGAAGDMVRVLDFAAAGPNEAAVIDTFEFADG